MSVFRSLFAQAKEISTRNELLLEAQNIKLMSRSQTKKATAVAEIDQIKIAPISK